MKPATENITLEDVLITDQLLSRARRSPEPAVEVEALYALTQRLTAGTHGLLRAMVDTALVLCNAGTAGLSVVEESQDSSCFRWQVMAGVLADHVGHSTPREFSPCHVTLAAGTPQLFRLPERYFTYLQESPVPIMEGLVIPLPNTSHPPATIWIVTHEPARHFDWEDALVMIRIASFVAAVQNVMATAAENERLYREAKAAMVARDSLIASIAHDLKTPLTAIRGKAQLISRRARRLAAPGSESLIHGLKELPLLVDRMTNQIDEMLDVSQLRAGQELDLQWQSMDAVELIQQCVDEANVTTGKHRVQYVAYDEPIVGMWDSRRLRRVFGNLLSNAIKYSPEGGTITVAIDEVLQGDQSWLVVSVTDQGVGILPENLSKVFEPFWRATDIAHVVEGSGIGLFSAAEIVRMHQGRITVDSQVGVGSVFTVRLPIRPSVPSLVPRP